MIQSGKLTARHIHINLAFILTNKLESEGR